MTPQQLKDFRSRKGWDQERAAKELRVSIHTIRSWEQGKNPIPPLVEKHLMAETDVALPIDLILSLNRLAAELGRPFEDVLFDAIKSGLGSLAVTQSPKKKRGAKRGD
jgi:transcriptional regulator with XRE-family HTH domain